MKTLQAIFVLISILISSKLISQNQTVNLWEGTIPGSIKKTSYKETFDTSKNWERIGKVSNPRLDIYLVPKEKSNGTAVVICPGGGYSILATGHEGAQVAKWFNNLGINAFVLKYRLPSDSIMTDKTIGPLQDAQESIRFVRRNAKKWNIDPAKIGVMGFSAGGHLASTLSTHYQDAIYTPSDSTSARPNFSLLIYPVISMDQSITHMGSRKNLLGNEPSSELVKKYSNELQVNSQTPPAFLVHSLDDNVVPVENSINYIMALKNNKVPGELHLYQSGGHGYGLGRTKNTESAWPEACIKWLKQQGFYKE